MQQKEEQRTSTSTIRPELLAGGASRSSDFEGLDALWKMLAASFGQCIAVEERERFKFCLRQFLIDIDTLYLVLLPSLTAHMVRKVECTSRYQWLRSCQQTWTDLRAIIRLLERLEALCQYSNGLIYTMLEALETYPEVPTATLTRGKDEVGRQPPFRQEEWERSYNALLAHLDGWQQYQSSCQTFATLFADLADEIPAFAQVDDAFEQLLDQFYSIFADILPDFRSITIAGDAEEVAVSLLDMMQKVDALLWLLDILLEPMHRSVKYYAIGAQMQ